MLVWCMNVNEIARERCEKLFELAKASSDEKLAKRYVSLARKIAMRHRIHLKKDYCRNCLTPFVEGRTVKTRVLNKTLQKTCLACGAKARKPVKKRAACYQNGNQKKTG